MRKTVCIDALNTDLRPHMWVNCHKDPLVSLFLSVLDVPFVTSLTHIRPMSLIMVCVALNVIILLQ